MKHTSIGPISDQICLQNCEKKNTKKQNLQIQTTISSLLVAQFTGVFFPVSGSSRANRATKRSFRARTVSLSIQTPQPSVTGRFGPISRFDLSDTRRIVSVPTVVSALVGDPSLRHTKPSCLGFLAKLFIPFSIFDKSLHSFCLPTYIHPAYHLLPPTHRPTSTHLHPPNYYLATYLPPSKYPSTYLPLSIQLQPLTHLHTYLPINKPNPLFSTPYPPTCLHTAYHLLI